VHTTADTMPPDALDLAAYAHRIGYDGSLSASLETLRGLVERHAATLPFENVDVLAGRVPRLDAEALQSKMVRGHRGGYCFEQNGLFLAVLRAVGFDAQGLEGRVRTGVPADLVTARSHMTVRVRIDGEDWMADVGFGGLAPAAPLRIDTREPQHDALARYRFVEQGRDRLLQCETHDGWVDCYRVVDSEPQSIDYDMANWWVATHPNAFLRHHLLVARSTPRGRLTLFDDTLSLRSGAGARPEERRLATRAEIADALADAFGLAISDTDLDAVMRVLQARPQAA
jgi:N-hydroxyarylamine O-acetyltransferase